MMDAVNNIPRPLSEDMQYQALLQKVKLANKEVVEHPKVSSKVSSTGGVVSPPPKRYDRPHLSGSQCTHEEMIGDRCVANCRKCGVFLPKVSSSIAIHLYCPKSGARCLRSERMVFLCCFPMTEILRTIYAKCMTSLPISCHPQYLQVSPSLLCALNSNHLLFKFLDAQNAYRMATRRR